MQFERTKALLGEDNFKKLNNSRVLVFGLGGVGGYVVEALARSGINELDLVDNDTISESNINRQIIATLDTIGLMKTEAFKERISKINPNCKVNIYNIFYLPDNNDIDFSKYDYVIDAIDTVTAKLDIIMKCKELNIPIISSMGTGNKLDPSRLKIVDISKTSVCPLAKTMRYELRKRGINHLTVCYSDEEPKNVIVEAKNNRHSPGSIAFVPSVAGLLIASRVINDLIGDNNE